MSAEIIEVAARDAYTEHLFKTERLRAELNAIAVILFVPAALEFHRHSLHDLPSRLKITLDKITLPDESELERPDPHPEFLSVQTTRFMPFHVDTFVENLALGRKPVLVPNLLEMNKSELSFTIHDMLQS
jgi:hypothetical protein